MQAKSLVIRLRVVYVIFVAGLFLTSAWASTNYRGKVLHNFGGPGDGVQPPGTLVSDAAGNLYGTTVMGGDYGYGTVFELSPAQGGAWTETVLHSFNNNGTDGWYPTQNGLTIDAAGNLYGTTQYGIGAGSVFQLSPNEGGGWTEKLLYNFTALYDGRYPHGSLIFDSAGNLYGTTSNGGIYCSLNQGCGTVFKLTPTENGTWTETLLHVFRDDGIDGVEPLAGLIFDTTGNLYGTTSGGGTYGPGTVFELTPTPSGSWVETILRNFGPIPDGQGPWSALTFDAAGNLYGTTMTGGAYTYYGTVFELSPNANGGWTETLVHSFDFTGTDGYEPLYGSLIFDAAGNFYGTTSQGGVYEGGTVFEFVPDGRGGWTETIVHAFDTDGGYSFAGLLFDSAGNIYGTTYLGGSNDVGVVFELSPVRPCIQCANAAHP